MLALLLILILHGIAWPQSAASGLYNEANVLYRRGEFETALEKYRQVAATGTEDVRLFYNLGNACFKSGRLGEAILWYERARRLDPRDEDVNANLRFANLVKQDREPEEGNVVWRFLVDAFFYPTLDELCLLFGFLLLLVFSLAVRRLWSRIPISAGGLLLMIACGGMTVLSGTFLAVRIHHRETVLEAIVISEQGTARSGPDDRQTAVFVVHEGTRVRVARREGDWLLVRLVNGLGGWLPASVVQVI